MFCSKVSFVHDAKSSFITLEYRDKNENFRRSAIKIIKFIIMIISKTISHKCLFASMSGVSIFGDTITK